MGDEKLTPSRLRLGFVGQGRRGVKEEEDLTPRRKDAKEEVGRPLRERQMID
jgi:hypothetical protein